MMNSDYDTRELARVYESQGHYQDALNMYQAVAKKQPEAEADIQAACDRMVSELARLQEEAATEKDHSGTDHLSDILAEWIRLILTECRLKEVDHLTACVRYGNPDCS